MNSSSERLTSDREAAPVPTPRPGIMFRRAVVRHCPRCGAGHLFRHWFSMVKRCPGCNYQFNREEGSSLGAYTINFGFTIGALGILMLFYIMQLASDSGSVSTVKWLTAAVVVALGVPAIGYPFSWTLWTAIDLTLHRGRFGPSRSADTGRYR